MRSTASGRRGTATRLLIAASMLASLTTALGHLERGQAGPSATGQELPRPMMNREPVWSPTDDWILFSSDRDGDSEIYLIDPDDATLRQLTDNRSADESARWTADGRHILFRSDRHGTWQTFRMQPDGSEQIVATDERADSTARDGWKVIVLPVVDSTSAVVTVAPDGTRSRLTRGSFASQPSFSPDGLQIVYEDRDGDDIRRSRIMLMDRDGSGRRVLAIGTDPRWSPDGDLVVFQTPTHQAGGFGWEVATARPDGSSITRLAPGAHPTWSPDGRRIAFVTETGPQRSDIWLMSREGGERRCLTCAPTHGGSGAAEAPTG